MSRPSGIIAIGYGKERAYIKVPMAKTRIGIWFWQKYAVFKYRRYIRSQNRRS